MYLATGGGGARHAAARGPARAGGGTRSVSAHRRPGSGGLFGPQGAAGGAGVLGSLRGLVQAAGGRCFLALFLLLLVLFNCAFFFFGGITLEVVKERDGDDDRPQLWLAEVEQPPQGQTCEAWLAEVDAAQGDSARDYRAAPVVVVADEEPRVVKHCSVGCHFVKAESIGISALRGANGKKSYPCDADLTRGSAAAGAGDRAAAAAGDLQTERTCVYTVLWQGHPWDKVSVPNDSHVVLMSTNLNSDVPVGQPSWADFPFLNPTSPKAKDASIVAILNNDCPGLQLRLELVRDLRKQELPVDTFGGCVGNTTSKDLTQHAICRYKFVLLFEDHATQDHLSHDFWTSLVCGTVPVVVAKANIAKFVPADNAFLQLTKAEERSTVVQWLRYLLKAQDAYADMLRWKDDPLALSDKFLALLDMSVVSPECRLCLHIATQEILAAERQLRRPCRCWEESSNSTVYHLFIRERGRFKFFPFFLRSTELTVASLVRAVYHLFKSKNHDTIWKGGRPVHLAGSSLLRAFRIYPVVASQDMALQGRAAFHTDKQLRTFVEAYPCPKLEVILL